MEVLYMPSPARSASTNQIPSIHYEDDDMIEDFTNPKLHTLSHSVSHPGHTSADSLTQPPKKKKTRNKILNGLSRFKIRMSQSLNKLASHSREDVRTGSNEKTRSRNRSDNSHIMSSAMKKTPSVPQSYSAEVFQNTSPTNHVSFNIDSFNCLSDSRLNEDKDAVSFDTSVKRHYSTGDMLGAQDDLDPRRPRSDSMFNSNKLYKCRSADVHKTFKRFSFGFNTQFGRASAYEKQEPLGEGSYATVYKGISRLTQQIVALKEHRLQEDEGAPFTAIREASLLRELRHANIVTLHDIVHEQTTLTFVFEYVESDLNQYNERHPGGLHSHNVKIFLFQLLRGLAFCHKKRILHRDLKPQNLLISEQGELKLADFGLARAKSVPSKTYSNEVVTLWYRPPDVLLGSTQYNSSLDMWGVGCIFLEMLTGTAAFPGMKDANDQLDKIWRVLGTPDPVSWPGIEELSNYLPETYSQYSPRDLSNVFIRLGQINGSAHLASKLLSLIPEKRFSAEESMRHKYFSDLPESVHHLKPDQSVISVRGCEVVPEMFNKKSSIKTNPRIPHSKSAHAGIS